MSEIKRLLEELKSDAPSLAEGKGKSYEVREFLREASEATSRSTSWAFCYSGGQPAFGTDKGKYIVRLRGSPGLLEPIGGEKYTHFTFFDKSATFELHAGVQVSGDSRAGHELDIMIVDRCLRMHCSSNQCSFLCVQVIKGIECKDYSGEVGKHLIRSFVLVTQDHNIREAELRTSGSVSEGSRRLLAHYGVKLRKVP